MDYHGMKRKELQNLCRKHGIPANLKNCEMADRLALIFKEKENEEPVLEEQSSSGDFVKTNSVKENLVESKKIKKVKFSPESEIFEFTRSVKKCLRRNGKTKSEGPTQDFPDSGKDVRRSKRNAGKGKSGNGSTGLKESDSDTRREPEVTEKKSSMSTQDVPEEHKVLRRSKRIARSSHMQDGAVGNNADKLYKEGQGPRIEQPPGMSSDKCLEEGRDLMLSKQFADEDATQVMSLGIKVNEPEMEGITQGNSKLEKVPRRSKRIAANVKGTCMEAETLEVETWRYVRDSLEEGKVRQSKRLAATDEAKCESVKNDVNEPSMGCEAQITGECPGRDAQDVLEVEKVPRRSRRIADNVTLQNAAAEDNINKLHLVDENLETGKRGNLEVGKASRRSKRIEANDGSRGGALKISVREPRIGGGTQTQETEKQSKSSSWNDFQDRKLLRRSKRFAVDDNAQGGAPDFNMNDQHVEGRNQVTEKQHNGPTDDGLQLGKAVRRSKRFAANDEDRIGVLEISDEPDMEGETQAANQRTRKCTQVGLEAQKNFRRSKRFAAGNDKQAGASRNNSKKPHTEDEKEVPPRSARNASRHNSRKAPKVLDENPVGRKKNGTLKSLTKSPTKAAGKRKRDRLEASRTDMEVVSLESNLTLEGLATEYAQLELEAAGISNGTEFSSIELTARSSSKTRKVVKQECKKEKPQGLIEDSPSLSEAEAVKPVMSIENILDPPSEKFVDASKDVDSQQLDSEPVAEEHEEKHEDSVIQAEINKDAEETLSLSQFPSEGLPVGAKSNNTLGLSEVKSRTAGSSADGYLFDETARKKASAQLAESKVEFELDVPGTHIRSKDIASTSMMEDDTEIKKETSASTLESDLSEHIDIDEATAQGILEKCPHEVIKNSPGCWKEIHSGNDHGKASLEKEIQAACLSRNFSEYTADNSTAKAQTEKNIRCDTNGRKTSETMIVLSAADLEERIANKKEEFVGVTSSVKYTDGNDIDPEGVTKSSSAKQTNLLVMDIGPVAKRKPYFIKSVKQDDVTQIVEGQEDATSLAMLVGEETENSGEIKTENTTEDHPCTEISIQEIEETDVQAKDAGFLTCEEIDDTVLTFDVLKLKEMVANETVLMKSSIGRRREEGSGKKEEAEVSNLIHDEVVTDDKGKKAVSVEVISGDCEKLETPAKVEDDSLKNFEETKFSDRGNKKEVLDLSRYSSTNLASKVFKEESMNASFKHILGSSNACVIKEELANVKQSNWVDNSDVLEKNEAAVDDACVVPEKGKMSFGTNRTSYEMVERAPLFASPAGDKSRLIYSGTSSPHEGTEGTACKKRGNKAARFHDEPAMFTILERNLMLREQLDEAGKTFAAESVTDYTDKAVESRGKPVILAAPGRHPLLGDSGLDEAGNKGENKSTEFRDESVIFTRPERHLLLGDFGPNETGNERQNTAPKFHDESVIFASPERHQSLGDPKLDEAGNNEENKAVEFHGESGIFRSTERHLDSEPDEAENKENKAAGLHDKSAIFTGPKRHPLLGDSELDEVGTSEENKAVEFQSESSIFASPERHLPLEGSASDGGGSRRDAAAEFHDKSPIFTGPERYLLLEDSESDEARKNEESKVVEFHGESCIFTSLQRPLLPGNSELEGAGNRGENTGAKFEDEAAVFTGPERHPTLGDSELDEAGKSDGNKVVEFNGEFGVFSRMERHLVLRDTVQDEAENKGDTATKFHVESAVFTGPERYPLSGYPELDEAGKRDENKTVEIHVESGLSTSPQRHLLLGGSEINGGSRGENAAAEFDDESPIFTGPGRHLLLEDSELDESRENEENKAVEFHGETGIFTSAERHLLLRDSELDEAGNNEENTAAEFRDESAILSSSERLLLLGDSELDEAGKIVMDNRSAFFTSSERRVSLGESALDESGKKGENKEVEFHDESTILTSTERHLVLEDSELDKGGLKGERSGADALTEFNANAIKSKTNAVTIGKVEKTTQDLEHKEDQHDMISAVNREHADIDSDKFDLSQSQSHRVSSPKFILAKNTVVIGSRDASLDTTESTSIDSNCPMVDKILCSPQFDAEQEAATEDVMPMDTQVEDFECVKDTQETSNGSLGNLPQVDSANLADLDGQRVETITEVDRSTLLDSHVFEMTTDGNSHEELKLGTHNSLTLDPQTSETITNEEQGSGGTNLSVGGQPEVGRIGSMMNPTGSPFVSEESKSFIHSQDQINDTREELMVTSDNTDTNGEYELIEAKVTDNNEGKATAETVHKSENYKDFRMIGGRKLRDRNYEGYLQLDSSGSHASGETYIVAGKEDEHSEVNSEEVSGNPRQKGSHEFLEAIGPAASEKSVAVFALQSEAHDSISTNKAISPVELSIQENRNEQDEKIVTREPTASSQKTPEGSSKGRDKVPDTDVTNTLSESQFSCFIKRRVGREPSLIHRTQVKLARHDMKENAPSSKIEETLNVTAPRTSKRWPLQDLRKN